MSWPWPWNIIIDENVQPLVDCETPTNTIISALFLQIWVNILLNLCNNYNSNTPRLYS